MQLGLRVAGSCGIAARARAMVRRDVGAAAPKALSVVCIETLCRVGDEVVSMLVVDVVWRNFSRGLASSSLFGCPVFAPHLALTVYFLRL
jgi:hypothetical protein